ncbi:MAG: hypothetical protein ACRDFB_11075 [Rhabdochlamydiaceae bacterium]
MAWVGLAIGYAIMVTTLIAISVCIWKIWKTKENKYPLEQVGIFVREKNDEGERTMNFVADIRAVNVIGEYLGLPNRNVFINGLAGNSGKSTLAEAILYDLINADECKKYFEKPVPAVVFSPKKFAEGDLIDFEVCGLKVVDCCKLIPNIFADRDAFVESWEVMVGNKIDSKGITASQIAEACGSILAVKECKSWADFKNNIAQLRKRRDEVIMQSQLTWIENKIPYLDVGVISDDIPISNVIYHLGNLPEKARIYYYEAFLQMLVKKLESGLGAPPILVLDEAHLLFKQEFSIIARYMRELRNQVFSIIAISQNKDDCNPALLQFSRILCGQTSHLDKYVNKPTIKDCVMQLQPRQFVDWTFTGTDIVPCYSLNKKYVKKLGELKEEMRRQKMIAKESVIASSMPPVVLPEHIVPIQAVVEVRADKGEIVKSILSSLEIDCHYANDFNKGLGFDRNDKRRADVNTVLKRLVGENKVRVLPYVTEKKNLAPRKIYYTNEGRMESTVHLKLVDDIKFIVEGLGDKVTAEYKSNQSWDISTARCYCEAFTGLKKGNLKDDVTKLRVVTKPLIFVCVNHETAGQLKESLSYVDGLGKYSICCLDTLADVIRSLEIATN